MENYKPKQHTLMVQSKEPVPEPILRGPEYLLTEDYVNELYREATHFGPLDKEKKPVNVNNWLVEGTVSFNPNGLEKIRDKLVYLAYNELPQFYFITPGGADVNFFHFRKHVTTDEIEKAIIKKNIPPDYIWTNDKDVRNKLLSLYIGIGFGDFIPAKTSYPVCFGFNKDRYDQRQNYKKY